MMKNNVKNFRKIGKFIQSRIIKFIGKFNHKIYMRFYIKHLRKNGMDIKGVPIYIGPSTQFDGKDYSKIHIDDRTVISSDVRFLTHDYSISRAIEATGKLLEKEVYTVRDIFIGKNCFIGTKTILMPGSIIGNNVIVGAGSVIRGKVEDNSIIIGNPGVVVGNTIEWAKKKIIENEFYSNR
jgi:acetyltransferase-like isoleucine patch superfamily enzyme